MKKLMVIWGLGLILPINIWAFSADKVPMLKSKCYQSEKAMTAQEWRACQGSIMQTFESVPPTYQEAAVIGPLNEVDNLTKQIEEMEKIIKLLQSLIARYSN